MRLLLLGFLLLLPWLSRAQPPLQVVNRVIEKTMPYVTGQPIQINAQKADIVLQGWSRPVVSVQLKLQAKHPERSVAEREVNYHQYTVTHEGGPITLANQFVIPQQAGKLQSQLKAIYEIRLPHQAVVRLSNSFGDVQVSELSGDLIVTLEFGKLTLTDIKGKLFIQSTYGDIDGHALNATLTIKAEKAEISLEELGGMVQIHSHFGGLTVVPASTLRMLGIEAERTAILISPKRLQDFHVEIASLNAAISVPEMVQQHLLKSGHKQLFSYQPGGQKPEITIKNKYSTVILQGEKPLVRK